MDSNQNLESNHWNLPPKFKFYEALGVLADNRLTIDKKQDGSLFAEANSEIIEAKSYSSSRNKFYIIKYHPNRSEIMTNDNHTWFKELLGYPALGLLCYL